MARLWKSLLVCTIAAFVLAAGYISYVIYERQVALADVSRYNVAWSASQAVIELTRLQQALAGSLVASDPDEVQLRYDLFLNRLTLLDGGEFHRFAERQTSTRAVIEALGHVLPQLEPLVGGLGKGDGADRPAIMQAQRLLAPLTPALLALAAGANRYGGEMVAFDQRVLFRMHWLFSALVAGLILCGCGLVALLLWHNGMLEQARRALQRMTDDLRASRGLLDAALNNMSQGLCMVDAEHRLIVSNRNFSTLLMIPSELLTDGRRFDDLLDPAATDAAQIAHARELLLAQCDLIAGNISAGSQEELPDGRIVAITHQPMADGGWIATYEDVTERRRAQDRIAYIAHHDALTGLPNRLMFHEEIEKSLTRVRRGRDAIAVHYLDLDCFKQVNDTLGHPVGDSLLRMVATRLLVCARPTDLVARLGGDEFAIIQYDTPMADDARAFAQRLVDAISAPYDLHGHQVVIGTSVGIALAPTDATESESLMTGADLALYQAKSAGRGTFCFFAAEMAFRVRDRRRLELELRHALANSEFEVFYQPLINVARDEVCGFEALVRWNHPEKGLCSPAVFIPLAEEIGLISQLGEWVLERACAEVASWPGLLKIAVNLSVVQFRSPDRLIASVRNALANARLAPERLELEITETVVLHDNETNSGILHALHDIGVRISMDDFGTGYSSLSYLRRFPFDKIKIDKSFVSDMDENQDSKAIVHAVAALASTLGMTTTAEGVETQSQFDQLRRQGCTEVQGYLISPAIPAAAVPAFLDRWDRRHEPAERADPLMLLNPCVG